MLQSRGYVAASVLISLGLAANLCPAAVSVSVQPASPTVTLGELVTLDIVADFGTEGIIGWGLDLTYDPLALTLNGAPSIGSFWDPVFAPDGDGLAASANPFSDPDGDGVNGSVSGNGIILASLTFSADALGVTEVLPGYTASDLNEGFALDPTGFADIFFGCGQVTVVPEPFTGLLMAGLLLLPQFRPKRGFPNRGIATPDTAPGTHLPGAGSCR